LPARKPEVSLEYFPRAEKKFRVTITQVACPKDVGGCVEVFVIEDCDEDDVEHVVREGIRRVTAAVKAVEEMFADVAKICGRIRKNFDVDVECDVRGDDRIFDEIRKRFGVAVRWR